MEGREGGRERRTGACVFSCSTTMTSNDQEEEVERAKNRRRMRGRGTKEEA